jgi:hypothetical protein
MLEGRATFVVARNVCDRAIVRSDGRSISAVFGPSKADNRRRRRTSAAAGSQGTVYS